MNNLVYILKWIILALIIGSIVGSASAFFLITLHWATQYREENLWIIVFLPIAGFIIGVLYHYLGREVSKGNNLIIEECLVPKTRIPFRMGVLVYLGTIFTHLFGGSAGREGTAVQMGVAISERIRTLLRQKEVDRKTILIMGISSGFASVFGTPIAGTVFSLEVLIVGRLKYESVVAGLISAIVADTVCLLWNVSHTKYTIFKVPEMSFPNMVYAILVGIACGITALSYSKLSEKINLIVIKYINYPPLRPFLGGVLIALVVYMTNSYKYIGLGINVIQESFINPLPIYDFLVKSLYTAFTLGVGFKGGEVTPLFFIGATLGNSLSNIIPLPLSLLAGMGFVSVFAGATNTPLACTIMGLELFGVSSSSYIALSCFLAYQFSGHTGIYTSQIIGSPKHPSMSYDKGKTIKDIGERIEK